MGHYDERCEVSELLGKTLKSVKQHGVASITFITTDGVEYLMYHEEDCCESVEIEDICGDLNDLVGEPLLVAEEASNCDGPPKNDYSESYTWTFYKFATIKGHVTIRWYGESNGYYSESADFIRTKDPVTQSPEGENNGK